MHSHGSLAMELLRKAVHILVGVGIVFLFTRGLLDVSSFGLLVLLYAALLLFNLRYQHGLLTKVISINRADRDIPGLDILFYFVGCFIVLLLFDERIAFSAILILAFADPLAHLASRGFGRTTTRLNTTTYLEGTLVGIAIGTLVAWRYVALLPALIASAVAMLFEAGRLRIRGHHVDDNLVIPVVAAVVLWVLSLWFGIYS
jgi:dolichol kinase